MTSPPDLVVRIVDGSVEILIVGTAHGVAGARVHLAQGATVPVAADLAQKELRRLLARLDELHWNRADGLQVERDPDGSTTPRST